MSVALIVFTAGLMAMAVFATSRLPRRGAIRSWTGKLSPNFIKHICSLFASAS